jgi:uncharacterized protein
MKQIKIGGLYIYPIKSCRGISLQSAIVNGKGLQYDRYWMLVDEDGFYVTQRKFPKMALIKTAINPGVLLISAVGMSDIQIGLKETSGESLSVKVWDDSCDALVVNPAADEWFSGFLDKNVRLVFIQEKFVRPVDPRYAVGPFSTAFTDGFPILLISQASLDDLNSRLETPILMDRFRPNIVVSDASPFEEDSWKSINAGDIRMDIVKPCARCVITTTDQQTAQRYREPLAALAKYRTQNNKVMFGQNVIHQNKGKIKVGDVISIIG